MFFLFQDICVIDEFACVNGLCVCCCLMMKYFPLAFPDILNPKNVFFFFLYEKFIAVTYYFDITAVIVICFIF